MCEPVGKASMSKSGFEGDIAKALKLGFSGSYHQRRKVCAFATRPHTCSNTSSAESVHELQAPPELALTAALISLIWCNPVAQ